MEKPYRILNYISSANLPKFLICFISLIVVYHSNIKAQVAQKWCLSDQMTLVFSNNNPDINNTVGFESNAIQHEIFENGETFVSVTDPQGNIIFYADAQQVRNKPSRLLNSLHQPIPNSENLWLYGNLGAGAVTIPVPQKKNHYYLFTLAPKNAEPNSPIYLYRHVIDMSTPTGNVIEKNTQIYNKPICEKLAVIRHSNRQDWWLIAHGYNNNVFVKIHIKANGSFQTQTQEIGKPHRGYHGRQGEMVFSPNGAMLGVVTRNGIADIYDFERCTGVLTPRLQAGLTFIDKKIMQIDDETYYGASFSGNSAFFYFSNAHRLYQVPVDAKDGYTSRTVIWEDTVRLRFPLAQHELAPDGKIYIASFCSPYLSVIHNPNNEGKACHFSKQGLYLNGKKSKAGLPHFGVDEQLLSYAAMPTQEVKICPNGAVLLGAVNVYKYSYLWSPAMGLSSTKVAQPMASPTTTTTYTLTVLDKTKVKGCDTVAVSAVKVLILPGNQPPCGKIAQPVLNHNTAPPNTYTSDLQVLLYPNPADDFVFLSFKTRVKTPLKVEIYDPTGRRLQLHHININQQDFEINTKNLKEGDYQCKFIENGQVISTYKLMIKRD